VDDFDDAIEEANRTCYGLAAGLVCDDPTCFDRFYREVRAGVINFNRPLTGASPLLPFGGVGCSGNNRPSAYFAADYASFPVSSLQSDRIAPLPDKLVGFR
jgi:succinylglutamic semialdehyde dehydrogenase